MPQATIGDNVLVTADLLKFITRIENQIEERKAINEDIRQILAEADLGGYDKKTIKECIKMRAMDPQDRQEQQQLRDLYLQALGLL